jgi:GDPmannose 4,6-dehydratase
MFHLHPYSIAKIMGHSMVDFYRKTYGLPFSNGVIFTTESKLKKPVFLLNKIAKHIKQWKLGEKEVLKVGNLDSYKNILHARDVANAIKIITEQEKGENYLICSKEKYKVLDLVLQLYSQGEIELEKKENVYFEKNTNIPVLIIENGQLGVDSIPINIIGNPTKLINLGWKPQVPIEYILKELL